MHRWIVGLAVGLFGCGPQVAIDDGDDTEGGSGDAGLPTTGISADATGPGSSPVTSAGDDGDDGTIIDDFGSRPGCGDGDVCLEPGPTVPIEGTPVGIAAGDIDGDGIHEILVSEADGPSLLVARVSGGGVVLEPRALPVGTQGLVTVGDLDDDARADVAASVLSPPTLVVAFGPALEPLEVPMPVDLLLSVTYARNETGPALLMQTQRDFDNALDVLVPNGNGGFELVGTAANLGETHLGPNELSEVTPVPRGPGWACASILAMAYDFSIERELRLDVQLGTDAPAATLSPLQEEPTAIAVAEVDGDEFQDLFVATPGNVARYTATSVAHLVGSLGEPGIISLAVGDFDGDGLDDLAGGIDTGQVWLATGFTTVLPGAGSIQPSDAFPHAIAAGDFDGNGRDDLAILDFDGLLSVWLTHP